MTMMSENESKLMWQNDHVRWVHINDHVMHRSRKNGKGELKKVASTIQTLIVNEQWAFLEIISPATIFVHPLQGG